MKIAILITFLITTFVSCQRYESADRTMITPISAATPSVSPTPPSLNASENRKHALTEALADERRAKATYKAVIAKFGNSRPFVNIVKAEARHESFLVQLFAKYNVELPEDQFANERIDPPSTMIEACKKAVDAENANIAMYDRLLVEVSEADIKETFNYLRNASKDNHLPAFERCSRGGGRGPR